MPLSADALDAIRARLRGSPDLARVERAMADGTFGLCASCGEELDPDALVARPTLGLCPDCLEARSAELAARRFGVCGVRPRS